MIFKILLVLTTVATGQVNEVEFNTWDDCLKAQYIIGITTNTHTIECKMTGVALEQ